MSFAQIETMDIDMTSLISQLEDSLLSSGESGAGVAAGAAGVVLDGVPDSAILYAQERAAELVGMRLVDGRLIPHPDSSIAITGKIREQIRQTITSALEKGKSQNAVRGELERLFSPDRADTIARTETAFALNEGAAGFYEDIDQDLVDVLDGVGCLPNGHVKRGQNAGQPTGQPGVVERNKLANGQVWTIGQMREFSLGHPRCRRSFPPHQGA